MRILFDGLRQVVMATLVGAIAATLVTPSSAAVLVGPDGIYEDFDIQTCSTNSAVKTCAVTFSPVPVGRTLVVKTLSCRIETTKPGDISEAVIETVGVARRNYFVPTFSAASATRRIFLASSDVSNIVKTLARPRILITTLAGNPVEAACSIGGTLY